MKSNIYLIILAFFCFSDAYSQQSDTTRINYGLRVGGNYSLHQPGFSKLPSVPSCCDSAYETGSGIGFQFGLFYQRPITQNIFYGIGLDYLNIDSEMKSDEPLKIRVNDEVVDGVSTHTLNTSINYLDIKPYLGYKLGGLNFSLSGNIGYNISSSYEQEERITNPSSQGVFINEDDKTSAGRVRNELSGDEIADMKSLNMGIGGLISYDLPMNDDKSMMISPFIGFRYGLADVHSDLEWKFTSLNAGLSLKLFPDPSIYKSKEILNIDTVEVTKDYIAEDYIITGRGKTKEYEQTDGSIIYSVVQIDRTDTLFKQGRDPKYDPSKVAKVFRYKNTDMELRAVDDNGNETKLNALDVKVELTREIYPLLPYVFFEENSSLIPQRYNHIRNAKEFDAAKLQSSPIIYHRNNLNIIGQRMLANPSAKITAVGYIDPSTEDGRCDLALQRAMSIKNYLVTVFGVEANRITAKTEGNCVPIDLTKTKSDIAYQENRRVVISSNQSGLLFAVNKAVVQEPTYINPPSIKIDAHGEVFVSKYDAYNPDSQNNPDYIIENPSNNLLSISQSQYSIFHQTYGGKKVDEQIKFSRKNIQDLRNGEPIRFLFKTSDIDNSFEVKTIEVMVNKDTADIAVEKLTLTIFQVSQTNLDSRIKKEIKKFISILDASSTILIKGYSDDLGNYDGNKNLSKHRAVEVENYIRTLAPRAKILKVVGVGSDEFPPGVYSYSKPEERFISRTVEIEIRSKIKR